MSEYSTVAVVHIASKLDVLAFETNKNDKKNAENFPTNQSSALNVIKKTEELSREHDQKNGDS